MISLFLQIADEPLKLLERDFSGSPYVPVYVMLPVRTLILLMFCCYSQLEFFLSSFFF